MVHLQDEQARLASTLAHGDQRALEVAIALGCNPQVLLLDEPTAGMSPYETQEMVAVLQSIVKERGLTVILSEHDMDVVFGLAEQITVMEAGKVLAEGTPSEIKRNKDVIQDLHAYYDRSHVLQGINLHVKWGEVVALLGRSGAGKTTTFRAIVGLMARVHGSVRFGGVLRNSFRLRNPTPYLVCL